MSKKPKATYPIVVDVGRNGGFKYSLEGNPSFEDPSLLLVRKDETVSWQVFHGRPRRPVPFQVEFGVFNPLQLTDTVIRSRGERTKPAKVNLGSEFAGNLIFKYTISTLNGWWQDPDIVPVPSDGFKGGRKTKTIALPLPTRSITLSVVTDAGGARYVKCDPDPKSLGPGLVVWQWAENAPKVDDFTLSFDKGGSGYFPDPVKSVSQKVFLSLPTTPQPQSSDYQLITQTESLEGDGTLTITVSKKRAAKKTRAAKKKPRIR